jgi:putative ABC transport system permease protein
LAAVALAVLGGDLGGGYFPGVTPRLQWSSGAALVYGVLGVAAAAVGGWWPARQAERLPPAQTLKGMGLAPGSSGQHRWTGVILIILGALLANAPPVFGIPLAAYLSVALILLGGISALPGGIALLYDALSPWVAHHVLPLLAVERARRQRNTAAIAISGVVASLSLAVALTVMVTSFRQSVTSWLDVVLPAGMYVRMANSATAGDSVYFEPEFVQKVSLLLGVKKLVAIRVSSLQMEPTRPPVALIARPLDDPLSSLPLVGMPVPLPAHLATTLGDVVPVFVSEAFADLYQVNPGQTFKPFGTIDPANNQIKATLSGANFFVAGIWRDYARQHGSIAMDQADFVRLSGDHRVNDLALWLGDGVDPEQVQLGIRLLVEEVSGRDSSASQLLEFSSAAKIRSTSLAIFDRSFAVTYWLQAVAIAIGLFGVAASFSAQVLARRKEFGLLVHLGLTRRQILSVVAGEGFVWTLIGSIAGLILGLAVAVVLVDVVNPQSFHWTMDLAIPWLRLMALCAAVVLAGTLTAWLAGGSAAGRDAVLAVKEDW